MQEGNKMEENIKKAFDFAADQTKQLITLSSAIITLTVTFSKDIIGKVDNNNRYWLFASWIMFIISILLGVLTLMALTGNLDPMSQKKRDANGKVQRKSDGTVEMEKPSPNLTITSSNVTGTGQWQVWTFLIALAITCWYGYKAATSKEIELDKAKNSYMVIRKSQLGSDTTTYVDTLYLPKTR